MRAAVAVAVAANAAFAICFITATESLSSDNLSPAFPEEMFPGLVRFADLEVTNGVKDGCWTNASTVEAKARLMLEQNDVSVQSIGHHTRVAPQVWIRVYGHGDGPTYCVAHVSLNVRYAAGHFKSAFDGTRVWIGGVGQMFQQDAIVTGPKTLNERIWDFLDGSLSEFLADVVSQRDEPSVEYYFSLFPADEFKPLTEEEHQGLVSSPDSSD